MIEVSDIAVYVVNLSRRPDRRERMLEVIPSALHPTFTSDWSGPFDGHTITVDDLKRDGVELFPWEIESDNPWWSRPLKLGEIGCTLSHIECWRHAVNSGKEYALIFEDDVCLVPDFLNNLLTGLNGLNRGEFPGLIYLGRYLLEPDQPGPPGFVRPGYSHCTYGYLLTRAAIEQLLQANLQQAIVPIDEFLPAMYIDHPRADIRRRFPPRITALAFTPPIAFQLPKEEAGSDTEDSEFVDWHISNTQHRGFANE